MKHLQTPLFVTSAVIFFIHQLLQYGFNVYIYLVDAYLDNLLAMPIILTLLQTERRLFFRSGKSYRLSGVEILLATTYVAAISEFIFPLWSHKFVFDWIDFLFFYAGAILFWYTERSKTTAV